MPRPLPPDPPLIIDAEIQRRLEAASIAVGRLDGIGRLLPGPDELLYSYVRKEAVLSSQIEGTQSSLTDLVLHESDAMPGLPEGDVAEVSRYVKALRHGIELLATLPVSLRLIRQVHAVLVEGSRGGAHAGEFRRQQNWIGGATPRAAVFVPPPVSELGDCLAAFEKFLHWRELPTLVRVGLAHAQFETIHPFLDGNGRVGRMLIPLLLVAEGVLERPWLYVSLHFKRRRAEYYDLLQRVRTEGAWEAWLSFYLDGLATVADEAVSKIRELSALFARDRDAVQRSRSGSLYQTVAVHSNLQMFDHLRRRIAVRIPEAAKATGTTKPTATRALDDLVRLGIAREVTGRPRNRVFVYKAYLDILNRD